MAQSTQGEDDSNPADQLDRENSDSGSQKEIILEILSQEFAQDKSPLVKDVSPIKINFREDNYTTIERLQGDTLYNSDGKVEATISPDYFANIKKYGFEVPTVVTDTTGTYILMPSGQSTCPELISYNGQKSKAIHFSLKNAVPGEIVAQVAEVFIKTDVTIKQDENYPSYYTCSRGQSGFESAWKALIQKGVIRFVDEEKVKHFLFRETPSLDLASNEIKGELRDAAWTAEFKGKKTLFTRVGDVNKLKLFDWESDISANWSITEFELPKEITPVTAGGLDPRENFLLVGSGPTLYVLDPHSKPIKIIKKIDIPDMECHGVIHLKDDGTIIVGDKNGKILSIASNLHNFVNRREKLEREHAIQRLRNKKRIRQTGEDANNIVYPELESMSTEIYDQFIGDILGATSFEQIERIKKEISVMKSEYASELKDSKMVETIFSKTVEALKTKGTELLSVRIENEMRSVRALIGRIDGMSLGDLADARRRVDSIKGTIMASNVDPLIKSEIAEISDVFADRAVEILGTDEDKLVAQIEAQVEKVKAKLDGISKLSKFETWESTDYLAFLDALASQMRIIPASHTKVIEKLRQSENQVRELKREYSKKFAEQYEDVAKKASSQANVMASLASDRIGEFLESFTEEVRKKHFRNAEDAHKWVELSPLYSLTLAVIEDLKSKDPERAEALEQGLKVAVAQLTYEVKQLKDVTIDQDTGREMVRFGEISMPKWVEDKVKKKSRATVELVYKVDESSRGAGVKQEDYMCELFYKVTDENGKVKEIPMHQDDVKKYGRYDERFYDDGAYFESHIPLGRARKMLSSIKEMESPQAHGVKLQHEEFHGKIRDLHNRIVELKSSNNGDWSALKEERQNLTKEYITFLQKSGVYAWYAFNAFRRKYKPVETQDALYGQGLVPERAPYWVIDEDTEKALEKFAKMAKLSLKNREGLISLEGHAGTGKDVLVQMFAEKTRRPLYSFDCSKWTTEFDLSQDVSLSAENGASFTVKDDSVIVKALERPGAVLYFNEFNAMPEQAQIFLHSLFDAKRQITLKTSSGRIVKADPTVIICSSMNPGYPGTNHPQFATRSRMIPIKLKYPEFERKDGSYGAAEALRIARSVDSLRNLTLDPDMSENEFVKLWDNYINKGISNGGMTPERKFDLEVIFALITFAEKIREAFIAKISKASKKTFKISQPFTLREMRRCAYILSTMDQSEKQNPDDAEEVAKNLVREFYSEYIFDEKESDELETNLSQWTAQKPMRTSP